MHTKPNFNYIEHESFKDASEKQRNLLAHQYVPLLNKIVFQWQKKTGLDFDVLYSMAEEGFVMALNEYNPNTSNMRFTQYAAYSVRNSILNQISGEANCVSLNYAAIKKHIDGGGSSYLTVSIDDDGSGDDDAPNRRDLKYGLYTKGIDEYNPLDIVLQALNKRFSSEDMYLFMSFFAIKDTEQKTASELAKERGVTVGAISQKTKKIVNYIKKNKALRQYMAEFCFG